MSAPVKLHVKAYLDIETLPTDNEGDVAMIDAKLKHPKKMTVDATIAKWNQTERPVKLLEAIEDTAKDGTYGRILAIGCAFEDEPSKVWLGDEGEVLFDFFNAVQAVEKATFEGAGEYHIEVTWIGHNVRRFDLRFLWQRAVIRRQRMPRSLVEVVNARYPRTVVDTMELWNPDRDKMIGIGELCRVLHIDSPKKEMDGSMVAALWALGQKQKIEEYCHGEIIALRNCYKRLTFAESP